jgi:predicted Zn finger-like uncharacterized protein
MIVKCPQCTIGYSIPENLITDKPRKMRCSRCKNVFTLMRRQDRAPAGYEEFTGQQHLPQEFAFLKSKAAEEAPLAEPQPEPQNDGEDITSEIMIPETDEPGAAVPEAEAAPREPAERPAPAAPVSSAYYAARGAAAPTRESWEEEMPLELSGYTIPFETQSRGAQAFGKLIFAIGALFVLLLVFVLFRNDWSLSFDELGSQVAFAFSGEKSERISDEARGLDVVVTARTLVKASSGEKYLVVTGDVFNRGFTGAGRIVLRGRLVGGAEDVRAEVRAPCGRTIDSETLKLTPKGAMSGHFRSKTGELYNCVISANGSTAFQLVFDDVPPEYEGGSLTLQVSAVSAQVAE